MAGSDINRSASAETLQKSARGFTLVEVVVALGVMSLILLATVSALRTFANTQVSLDKMIDRVDEVRTVSSFLRDILDGAVTGESRGGGLSFGGGGAALPYFEGNSNSLAWKAPALFGEAYGGVLLVRLIKQDDTLVLYWQEPPASNDRIVWDDKASRVLLTDVEKFEVGFRPEHGLPWEQGEWNTEGAPALVRLTIKSKGRYWPDLILRVQR